jgi:hypothetical protein
MIDPPEWLQAYSPAHRAALMVHLREIDVNGRSELSHGVVAERAGLGRTIVLVAVATAWARGHILVTPRDGEASIIRLPRVARS